jgi:hypothetical protein
MIGDAPGVLSHLNQVKLSVITKTVIYNVKVGFFSRVVISQSKAGTPFSKDDLARMLAI